MKQRVLRFVGDTDVQWASSKNAHLFDAPYAATVEEALCYTKGVLADGKTVRNRGAYLWWIYQAFAREAGRKQL